MLDPWDTYRRAAPSLPEVRIDTCPTCGQPKMYVVRGMRPAGRCAAEGCGATASLGLLIRTAQKRRTPA